MTTRLLALTAIALVMACDGARAPSGPTAPDASSKLISDGAHGGNPDFFFLPPMVANPVNDPNYEVGKFNGTLAPRLTVEICQLQASPVDPQGNAVVTDCVAGPPLKKFAAGTVQLQNMPDGFYQVQWKTKDSNLDVTKYYRIKVLVEGSSIPFGVADVDPVVNMKEFKNAKTGEVIPLNDDSTLPIKFRIEHGGGPALCGAAAQCTSIVVTNNSPAGFQAVTVDNGTGAVAGAKFPNGWLPAGGPQTVVVSISSVNLGTTDPITGAETTPCHNNLPLQQFPGCFNFSTTPELQPIDESGRTFAVPVIGAVCFSLYGTTDQRANFVEMYASDIDEPPHALDDASDVGILAPDRRNCSVGSVIASDNRNTITRFASSSWRSLKSGVGKLFGVQTAYAIDLGLGGFFSAFSNMGPALTATIQPVGPTTTNLTSGGTVQPFIRIVGANHHDGQHHNDTGIAGLPVTFTVTSGPSTLSAPGESGGTAAQLVDTTTSSPIDIENATSGGGYATVNWTLPTPTVVGTYTYTISANGPAFGGPVVFTYVVTIENPPDLSITSGPTTLNSAVMPSTGGSITAANTVFANQGGAVTLEGRIRYGLFVSPDPVITNSDILIADTDLPVDALKTAGGTFTLPSIGGVFPALEPGIYYVGILVDDTNGVAESSETNNYTSHAVIVVGPDANEFFLAGNEQRMLSMQTGATWRAMVTPSFAPRNTFVWTDPSADRITISAGIGYVDIHAIVGGENINADAAATVTGFYTDPSTGGQNPGTELVINSFSFNHFPRVTSLAWNAVEGAVAYHVVTEFGNGSDPSPPFCSVPATCTTWTVQPDGSTYTTSLTHLFSFVGSQPGRWRVFALDANGAVINTSPYVYFDYDV